MVVDASAVLAVAFQEPGWEEFEDAMLLKPVSSLSAVSRLEAAMVLENRKGHEQSDLDSLIQQLGLQVRAFDERQLSLAIDAFRRYGKGRHPAALNLGDCCSYGLAKSLNEPLLFKGDDFSLTDVEPALKG